MDKIDVIAGDYDNIQTIHPVVATDNEVTPKQTKMSPFSCEFHDALVVFCQSNIQYFERNNNTTANKRFLVAFQNINQNNAIIRQNVTEMYTFLHEYDFDERTPANGYRSIVKVTHEYINHTMKVSKYIEANRENWLFRKQTNVKKIESCSHALASLCVVLIEAIRIRKKCAHESLIPLGKCDAVELFNMSDLVDQKPFYGRCIGLHYCESIKMIMKILSISLVGFSELYYSNKKTNCIFNAIASIYNGSKYLWNDELRAKRFIDLSFYSDIDFAQAFLNITERKLVHSVPNMLSAKVKINKLITIATEPLEIENVHEPNKMVKVPIPSSHLGVRPLTMRLLSSVRRNGMLFKRNERRIHPVSNCLIFHCHGGGFVAHTSKSHEIYLRGWAAQLQVPILSIDYSLSPQAPYPRALEEAFYAYCWVIKNAKLLGTTAEKIIVVGDSAGAVLNMALTLKCIDQNVRRPNGALLMYAPLILGFEPTPSRLLTAMDILLPFGFLMKCLKAYVHPGTPSAPPPQSISGAFIPGDDQFFDPTNCTNKVKHNESITDATASNTKIHLNLSTDRNPADEYRFDVPNDPFISPLLASNEMLKQLPVMKFVCGEMDPLVDDSVTMAKRLKALGNSVGLDVLPGLPHGFLNFVHLSKDAYKGNCICISHLAELLGTTLDPKY